MRLVALTAVSLALGLPGGALPGASVDTVALDQAGRLYLGEVDGSGERALSPSLDAASPAWSPDGRRLAFSSVRGGGIYVVGADGRGLRRVTRSPALDVQPAWSPDGRRLVFVRTVQGFREEIFVVGADGRGLRRLTWNRGQDLEPDWAPNGRRIAWAFTSTSTRAARPLVHTMNPDGTAKRSVTAGSGPDWSPDGQRFALSLGGEIFTSEVSGGGRVQVTSSPGAADTRPDWSPDGTEIAFLSTAGSAREQPRVFVAPAAGGEPALLSSREPAGAPSWRP
ncbi:MAG: PD40 domain-containing protein [Actinobacteria bacterium]|nr:PD40 domain-containing protein [Actinomycetota bacterium]